MQVISWKVFILTFYILILLFQNFLGKKETTDSRQQGEKMESQMIFELNEKNFEEFNTTTTHYFIEFYSPWCKDCKPLFPIYESAAEVAKIQKIPCKFSKIDGIKNEKLAAKFKVTTYPTILWVDNSKGNIVGYSGERVAMSFIKFANRMLDNYKFEQLSSFANFQNQKISVNTLIIVCKSESTREKYKAQILNIGRAADHNQYGKIILTSIPEFLEKYNLKEELNILSFLVDKNTGSIGEGENIEFDIEIDLKSPESAINLISFYTDKVYGPMDDESFLERGQPILIYFFGEETKPEELSRVDGFMRELAIKYRKTLHMYNSNLNSTATSVISEVFGIKAEHMPLLLIIKHKNDASISDELQKYKVGNVHMTRENVEKFINDWQNNKLVAFLASEPAPENPYDKNGILKVVGSTFNDFLSIQNKDLVLALCTYLSKRCLKFEKRIERVAKKLKNNQNILIAKTDPNFNEFEVHIDLIFPVILFFRSDDNNTPLNIRFENRIVYNGDLTTFNITDFIGQNAHDSVNVELLENEGNIIKEEFNDPIEVKIEDDDESDFNYEGYLQGPLASHLGNDAQKVFSSVMGEMNNFNDEINQYDSQTKDGNDEDNIFEYEEPQEEDNDQNNVEKENKQDL